LQPAIIVKVEPGAKLDEAVYPKGINIGVQLIRAHGWKCDSLSSTRFFAASVGFYMRCNQNSYEYEIADRGGNWEVKLR
jgi:hypothetical protein